jgi:hypothetical protein
MEISVEAILPLGLIPTAIANGVSIVLMGKLISALALSGN